MEKNDNVQSPPATGETSTAAVATAPTTGNTSSNALGTPGFLQSLQQQFESLGDDAAK